MAKKFNMLELAKEALGDVKMSEVDTVRTIPSAEILPNPKNFYDLSDLDDLAASIEQNGLIDPLIVKRVEDGRYMIISGHRRFAAMTEILGKTEISCLIRQPVSDVFEELMLIEANRTQRKMSAADLSKQAERYTELLAQLKEAGVAIPGRLRDRVAEALQVSSTKLARLHAIRERLSPPMLARFDAGEINESMAYALSRYSHGQQATLWGHGARTPDAVNTIARRCGFSVSHRDASDKQQSPEPPKKAEQLAAPSSGTSYDPEAYLQEREEEDLKYFDLLRHVADRFLPLLTAGESRQDGIEDLKETYRYRGFSDSACYADGSGRGLTLTCPGFKVLRTWTEVYDMLCIIALRRAAEELKANEEPRSESDQKPAGIEWHDTLKEGPPPEGTMNVVCWSVGSTHGLYKPLPSMMAEEFKLYKNTRCRWWAIVPSPFEGQEEEET